MLQRGVANAASFQSYRLTSMNTTSILGAYNNNMLMQAQMFGFASRIRKRLGLYSYKLTKNQRFKNPHAISLQKRLAWEKQGYQGRLKIQEQERLGDRPFGRFTRKGKFLFDIEKVPFYNIPDLTNFKLKPYVSHTTPKIDEEKYETRKVHLDDELLEKINH